MIGETGKAKSGSLSAGASLELHSLVTKARDGDTQAFESLARYYWVPVYRMVYHRVRSKMDAEDLTQDVFVTVSKRINSVQDITRFQSWLYAITINKVRDHLRRRKLLSLVGFLSQRQGEDAKQEVANDESDPLGSVIRKDFWQQVEGFLTKLSGLEKEVFIMRFMDQLNINEISQIMGRGPSTIKTHLYRAIKKFREDSKFQVFLEGIE